MSDRAAIPPGTIVVIHGLELRTELNDTLAEVLFRDAQAGRYAVYAPAARKKVRIKEECLTIATRLGDSTVRIADSDRHGKGVFALREVHEKQLLFVDVGCDDLLVKDSLLRTRGVPQPGVSTAWPLTILF